MMKRDTTGSASSNRVLVCSRFSARFVVALAAGLISSIVAVPGVRAADGEVESIDPKDYRHITFKDIPPTDYLLAGDALAMSVKSSSSALVRAFKSPRKVARLRFAWKMDGSVKTRDVAHEHSKKGDDLPLRVGLIIKGPAPTVPFFAPAWIKAIADTLLHPSDRMHYFVAGAKTPAGQTWDSAYASSLQNRSVAGTRDGEGWEAIDTAFEALDVVGLWLMADGDNTDSVFVTKLRGLRFN